MQISYINYNHKITWSCHINDTADQDVITTHLQTLSEQPTRIVLPTEVFKPVRSPRAKAPFTDVNSEGFLEITFSDDPQGKLQAALDFLTSALVSRLNIMVQTDYGLAGCTEAFLFSNVLLRTLKISDFDSNPFSNNQRTKTLTMSFAFMARARFNQAAPAPANFPAGYLN